MLGVAAALLTIHRQHAGMASLCDRKHPGGVSVPLAVLLIPRTRLDCAALLGIIIRNAINLTDRINATILHPAWSDYRLNRTPISADFVNCFEGECALMICARCVVPAASFSNDRQHSRCNPAIRICVAIRLSVALRSTRKYKSGGRQGGGDKASRKFIKRLFLD